MIPAMIPFVFLAACSVAPNLADTPAASVKDTPKPVLSVTKEYQQAAKKEIPAVIDPKATPARVRSVHDADMDARAALTTLEAQGANPTAEALEQARDAVRRLSDTLNKRPN